MNIEEFRNYCLSLPATEEKMPFDDKILVFYVKSKMLCLADIDNFKFINVKCNPEKAIVIREQYEEVTAGYHMNKKHWNSVKTDGNISNELIKQWIKDSYMLVLAKLPKKQREAITALLN